MKYGIIFKKTSTCYANPDIEYLDETSDYKLRILCKQGKITMEEYRIKHDELERSISYLTKENHGRVYAGGFIRDALLEKKAMAPEKWDNEARKKAIKSAVRQSTKHFGAYRGALGHKLVFSVSDELTQKVEDAGLNLDNVLGREVKRIMYEFQHKFHRGEKIGFAWGIHHDTDHRHAHVYLCNRTNKGKHVAMSCQLKGRKPDPTRKDQMGYVKERCEAAQQRILQQVESMNQNTPVYENDVKIEPNPSQNLSEALTKRDEELKKKYDYLIEQENLLKLKQIKINRFYTHYNLRKELVSQGLTNVKALNKHIAENYQNLKKTEYVISTELLWQLGYCSCSHSLRQLSRFVLEMQKINEQDRRERIIDEINQSKELKTEILNRIKILDWQDKVFLENSKKMKAEREKLKREFYQNRRTYENDNLKFNFDFFNEFVKDRGKREHYYQAGVALWQKRKAKQDSSAELAVIKNFDKEAREIAQKLKVQKEDIEDKRNWQTPSSGKSDDQKPQDRGLHF